MNKPGMVRLCLFSMLISLLLLPSPIAAMAEEEGAGQAPLAREGSKFNLAEGKSYTVNEPADGQYPDAGGKLTDGKIGGVDYTDEAWAGFLRGSSREITIDLGGMHSVESIRAGFLQQTESAIRYPNAVSIFVSNNGVHWTALKHAGPPVPFWIGPAQKHTFEWNGRIDGVPGAKEQTELAYTRYVKVQFQTALWVFADEIEVLGYEGHVQGAKVPKADKPEYLRPGDRTGGISDLLLLYNGHYHNGLGDWTKENLIPYIAYVNNDGEPQGWFFDGILYLGLSSPEGRAYEMSLKASNWDDWKWYLDKTFADGGDLDELNEAVAYVEDRLGKRKEPYPVVLMIPYPAEPQTNFGDVDGDGLTENFNAAEVGAEASLANKKKAAAWYIDQVLERWAAKEYGHLRLAGLYWLNEEVAPDSTGDAELIRYAGELVHQHSLNYFWIPRYHAFQFFTWDQLGFDAAAYQPNHFFQTESSADRIRDAAQWAKQLGMGMELEFDERILTEPDAVQRYFNYLDGANSYGYLKHAFKAYYQGNNALLQAAQHPDPEVRASYDVMYQFVKGKYKGGK
ncbi:DUF4855 domain-containing protein [Paenibacillus sp. J2TS4]|uniref:DUF4855 domain-containing protein n=1 Tax=Paenibacillus sp. J2TS4 TaxID=2807194 RepID=UPI001B2F677D|nr:DUF4855 domain-containing protein [Paenibacillus sp. J2TS4]GIP34672.1 hypothetical protein J2TS4_38820 [Paenibacillus sp. J2TS4]